MWKVRIPARYPRPFPRRAQRVHFAGRPERACVKVLVWVILRRACEPWADSASYDEKGTRMRPRATRVHLAIPVLITGTNESGVPFKELTNTVVITANGCLIPLETPVARDQKLVLANTKSGAEIACHVATLQSSKDGKAQIGIHFDEPSPRFWGLGFPPEDWDPSKRKRPDATRR